MHALDYFPLSDAAALWPPVQQHDPPGWRTYPERSLATIAVVFQSGCHSVYWLNSPTAAAGGLRWLPDSSPGLPAMSGTTKVLLHNSSWLAFCLLLLLSLWKIACALLLFWGVFSSVGASWLVRGMASAWFLSVAHLPTKIVPPIQVASCTGKARNASLGPWRHCMFMLCLAAP